MKKKALSPQRSLALRHGAEVRLTAQPKKRRINAGRRRSEADTQRLVHELQVHQVELEMQNEELQRARETTEAALDKYTDLYDFAPVGYFSLDGKGRVLEVNLTGAALLGIERSRLIGRRLPQFVVPENRQDFQVFLEQATAGTGTGNGKHICEARVQRKNGTFFWAGFNAAPVGSARTDRRECRVSVSDLTALKHAEEAERRVVALAAANEAAKKEIARRRTVEKTLRKAERTQARLLAEAQKLHVQLRHVTRQILQAQEDERRNISRELHDEVAQILTGINVQLSAITKTASANPREFRRRISNARRLVAQSVNIVHRFARELRPTLLDDLGLIPALRAYIRDLPGRKKLHIHFTAFSGVEGLDNASRTVVYRVAQEALTNIVRHAHARRASVRIRKVARAVRIEVRDDGKSFRVDRILAPNTYKRLGLLGMRERVEMVGGTLTIESAPELGTTVRAEVPFPAKKRKTKT